MCLCFVIVGKRSAIPHTTRLHVQIKKKIYSKYFKGGTFPNAIFTKTFLLKVSVLSVTLALVYYHKVLHNLIKSSDRKLSLDTAISSYRRNVPTLQSSLRGPNEKTDILLFYVFSNTDITYLENLKFFLEKTKAPSDRKTNYILILQEGEGSPPLKELDILKSDNIAIIHHENKCFDVGTVGEIIRAKGFGNSLAAEWIEDLYNGKYKYITIMNSSVRGPFLPVWYTEYWANPFISLLRHDVALVGPTINCAMGIPHVQSYMWMMKLNTFFTLLDDGHVFNCYENQSDTVQFSELGASKFLLENGSNIASLMLRYRDIDFVKYYDKIKRQELDLCNAGFNPLPAYANNGVSLDALEVMFIKYKKRFTSIGWDHVDRASKYYEYDQDEAPISSVVSENTFLTDEVLRSRLRTLILNGCTEETFDTEYYRSHNYDLKIFTLTQCKDHFFNVGIFEARPWRCKNI